MHIFKSINTINQNSSAFEKIYITIFIWMLASCVFYPHGVEHARYAMIGLILIFFIRKKSELKNLCKSDSFLALLSFFTVALLSLLLNPAPLSRIDEVTNWIVIFISGYVASAITHDKNFRFILVIPIALLGAVIIYPVLSGAGGIHLDIFSPNRLTLYFHQRANHLGLICGAFAFALSYIGARSSGKIRALYFFLSCVCFFLLFRTSARASFLGTVVVFSGWLLWKSLKMRKRTIFLFIISAICATTLLLCSPLKNNRIISSATTGITHDISFLQRFFTWNVAYTNFIERPIIGWGFDTFGEQYAEEMKKYKNDQEYQKKFPHTIPTTNNAHNFFLQFLAETGIAGLCAMLVFWATVVRRGFQGGNVISPAVAGMYLISLIAFQMNMSMYGLQISTILFAFAGLSSYPAENEFSLDYAIHRQGSAGSPTPKHFAGSLD